MRIQSLVPHSATPARLFFGQISSDTPLGTNPALLGSVPTRDTLAIIGHLHDGTICMMASFYYQDQNDVGGLYCQGNFSNCLFIRKREDNFE